MKILGLSDISKGMIFNGDAKTAGLKMEEKTRGTEGLLITTDDQKKVTTTVVDGTTTTDWQHAPAPPRFAVWYQDTELTTRW